VFQKASCACVTHFVFSACTLQLYQKILPNIKEFFFQVFCLTDTLTKQLQLIFQYARNNAFHHWQMHVFTHQMLALVHVSNKTHTVDWKNVCVCTLSTWWKQV